MLVAVRKEYGSCYAFFLHECLVRFDFSKTTFNKNNLKPLSDQRMEFSGFFIGVI